MEQRPSSAPMIFIFDSTRLRSHLVMRYLSTHPSLSPIYHPFIPAAMFGPEHLAQHLEQTEARKKDLEAATSSMPSETATYASCQRDFAAGLNDIYRAGKTPLVDEHWFDVLKVPQALDVFYKRITTPSQLGFNPTWIPDSEFETLQPVILIRHPAISIDSIWRTVLRIGQHRLPGEEDFNMICEVAPLRLLFDYFRTEKGKQPVVVDGEDVLWRTEEVHAGLAAKLGIGPGLRDYWEPATTEEIEKLHPFVYMLTKEMRDSKGIERPAVKPDPPNVQATVKMWNEKYGIEIAGKLKTLLDEALPHYEYLSQFKI